ncbi:uncharacterized protein LTHEOB_5893 [Neofusicoccum parvum]|uniref:Uncharacterized protein LTHEOB_5893 n=1 Tax=Neofusicoccum parvum TaxID=310453 RepID=A0ACB5SF59_9PEZI|nr:uncharacterized protein LTHEOB_5893 [Neofusicoccum parvum]
MAATVYQASLHSVHQLYPHHLQHRPVGLSAAPWITTVFASEPLSYVLPAHSSCSSSSVNEISIATSSASTPPEMSPTDPLAPATDAAPPAPHLRPLPSSPVEINGRQVAHRPKTWVDQVATLRNPTAPATRPEYAQRSRRLPTKRMALRSTDTAENQTPQLQAPAAAGSGLARRRASNPSFTPPTLRRTQPASIWEPLTGRRSHSRDLAAAFVASDDEIDNPPPPTPRLRRAMISGAGNAAKPVTPTPRHPVLCYASLPDANEKTREPSLGEGMSSSNVAGWKVHQLAAQRRRLSRKYGGKEGCDFLQPHSFLDPAFIPVAASDEPLQALTEKVAGLAFPSEDEEEQIPTPRRRRGRLSRSMAGRFKMGDEGNLEVVHF